MNAPVKIQPRESALELLNLIETLEGLGRSAEAILSTMEIEGAYRRYSGGAYFVRFRGVVGSSKTGGQSLINAWKTAARSKFKLGEFA
jgi:hypothetical protein